MTANKKTEQWEKIKQSMPFSLQLQIEELVNRNLHHLAESFYAEMLSCPDSKFFLTNEEVKNRLNSSMQAWIKELFKASQQEDYAEFKHTQKKVGDVHARINLPVHLVLRGASVLKRELYEIFTESKDIQQHLGAALYYSFFNIDYAMEVMSKAYSYSYDRKIKAEESYRLFAAVTNSEAENERQNKVLLRGASVLKRELYEIFTESKDIQQHLGAALYYSFFNIDYAMEVMSKAYSYSYDRKIKAEESYRLFAAVTNSEAENERQNKVLL